MSDTPNILFILADDLGWRDLACYGSSFYETPNLDRLADQGVTFTDAYAACPVCSPTRASLLTGCYPPRVGVTNYIGGHAQGKLIDAPYLDHIPDACTTYPQALRDKGGYATWHLGKWHCGGEGSLPQDRGFDVNIGGGHEGAPHRGGYFAPWELSDPELVKANGEVPEGTYLDDYLADRGAQLIKDHDYANPFLMNFCFYLVHTPLQAPPELVEKYEAKARALHLDAIDPIVDGPGNTAEHRKGKPCQHRVIQSHATYAAMVEKMDQAVGVLLQALEDAGQADNTMVVFTSDNGGLSTSEGSPTSNLPLKTGKGWMYDGGTREPFIVKLPGTTQPGTTCHEPLTSPDLFPTLLEVAGVEPMPEAHADGVSFMPALRGDASFQRGAIFWHYPHYGNQGGSPSAGVRRGPWKLVKHFERPDELELFNLHDDISETINRADDQPELTAELHSLLANWQQATEARIPEPNPDYVHPADPVADPRV